MTAGLGTRSTLCPSTRPQNLMKRARKVNRSFYYWKPLDVISKTGFNPKLLYPLVVGWRSFPRTQANNHTCILILDTPTRFHTLFSRYFMIYSLFRQSLQYSCTHPFNRIHLPRFLFYGLCVLMWMCLQVERIDAISVGRFGIIYAHVTIGSLFPQPGPYSRRDFPTAPPFLLTNSWSPRLCRARRRRHPASPPPKHDDREITFSSSLSSSHELHGGVVAVGPFCRRALSRPLVVVDRG